MIKNWSFLFCFFILSNINTQTMLSGIVNVYSGLVAQNQCLNLIEIANVGDFEVGMVILIIQNNGASIQTSNGESFGNITTLNGAGLYEYNRITEINGQLLSLENTLQNTYLPSNTQVVGATISSDIIIDGDVSALAWDGNKGGIILIEAENSIEIQANIDASGLGFRSGQLYNATDDNCGFLTFSNDFSYGTGNWRGAPKGEGVAAIVSGAENGRGAQANGGGGGNSHNSGGGGGALYVEGGSGGINDEPGAFNCKGDFAGRGGKALLNDPSRLFFGGAGGNGHTNNSNESQGGKGGGIIILIAPSITFNGGQLNANGQDGQAPVAGDGSAGGGAAGSILIDAQTINGDVNIIVRGGDGGDVNNSNQNRCFGPGGGGSGGFLASNQALTAVLEGGIPGLSLNSTACSGNNGASAGGMGIMSSDFSGLIKGVFFEMPSIVSLSNDTIVCDGEFLQLFVETEGENLNLQWQYLDGNIWTNLAEQPIYSGTQTNMLTFGVNSMLAGSYRLAVDLESECFTPFNSPEIDVNVDLLPSATPTFNVDDFNVEFMANANDFNSLEWSFFEGENSTEINPNFTFPAPGIYSVVLQAENECGNTLDTLIVEITAPLIAQFSATATSGCAPLSILFTDESIGQIVERTWFFEGGMPSTSTEANPLVEFQEVGSFEVSLNVQNEAGSNTSTSMINVFPVPFPAFSFEIEELSVVFSNTSTNANNYIWNFGDGESSTTESPEHTYSTPGTYEVSLNAVNEFCGTALVQLISVTITGVKEINKHKAISIAPNPSNNGLFYLEGLQSGSFGIFDVNGKKLFHQKLINNRTEINLKGLPNGVYILIVNNEDSRYVERLLKG